MGEMAPGSEPDEHPPPSAPPPPLPPPPSPSSAPAPAGPQPASWPAPDASQRASQQASPRGFPWKVVGAIAAVVLLGAIVLGLLAVNFVGNGRFTAHIDRANDYLDALRTDPAAASAMLCPDAQDPNAEVLTTTTGQYLREFSISNGGTVTGSVSFADASTRRVQVETSGPSFPGGDDPATEVCIRTTSLS